VVFDLDGTLVDSLGDIALAVNRTLDRLRSGTPALAVDQVRRFVGHGVDTLMARTLEVAGIECPLDAAVSLMEQTYQEGLLETTRLFPGVAETLSALAGHDLAVLTNKPGDLSRAIVAGLRVDRHFVRVIGGGDGPPRKPDPEGLQLLMRASHAGPAQTVMVGDSAVDVQTGKAAGAHTVGVSYGLFPEDFARDVPDVVLDAMPQLLPLLGLRSLC